MQLALLIGFFSTAGCSGGSEEPSLTGSFDRCVSRGRPDGFEMATLNLKEFPMDGDNTLAMAAELVQGMQIDFFAFQELSNAGALQQLAQRLPGWSALFSPAPSGNMSLGYLFKSSEFEVDATQTKALFEDDSYNFPRAPFQTLVHHKPSGHRIYVINLHLKAFGDAVSVSRRKEAARKLKGYLDENLSDEKVVVLGDFNDTIKEPADNGQTFVLWSSDAAHYRFSDLPIALGNAQWFSYPSYPSHIDHVLITNELFSLVDTVMTLRPDFCNPLFRETVSDHCPVVLYLH